MRDFTPFAPDPVNNPSGTLDTYGINPDEQLMVYNDTIYGLKFVFPDGTWDVIPAAWNKDFIKPYPMGIVKWSIYNEMDVNPADYPQTDCYGILYEQGEHVPSVNQSMQRAFNITGGTVTSSTTQAIDNEGNASGSPFLKSVLSGQTNPSVLLTNDGAGYIAQLIASVLVNVFQVANVDPVVALGAIGHLVKILGTLESAGLITADAGIDTTTLDATGTVTASGGLGVAGGLTADTLNVSGAATLQAMVQLQAGTFIDQSSAPGANQIRLYNPKESGGSGSIYINGGNSTDGRADIASFDTDGLRIMNGSYVKFQQGGKHLVTIASGLTALLSAGETITVTHNLGVTPTAVVCTCYANSDTSTFRTQSWTTTTFQLYTYSASAYSWIAIASN